MIKVLVVTGSRAEYGLLRPVMKLISENNQLVLQIIVTGTHLEETHGLSIGEINKDGFEVDAQVRCFASQSSRSETLSAIGKALPDLGAAMQKLQPDWVLLLGDRFEIFAAAQAAYISGFPIAHIAGGDTTEGAIDEGFRHAITKLAQLHFPTNQIAAARIRSMGENPDAVFVTGSPGLDQLRQTIVMSKDQTFSEIGMQNHAKNILVTYHPVTHEPGSERNQILELITALKELGNETGIIFTMPNADPGSDEIRVEIEMFVKNNSHAKVFINLGSEKYLNIMRHVDAVVGNSSSGLYEAPALQVPTVNIGDRQKGRLAPESVIHCPAEAHSIQSAIRAALSLDRSAIKNPYGDGFAAEKNRTSTFRIHQPPGIDQESFL